MPKYRVKDNLTGEILTVEMPYDGEYSQEEIIKEARKQNQEQKPKGWSGFSQKVEQAYDKGLPSTIGSIAGSVAGPLGTAAGYSIGSSAETLASEGKDLSGLMAQMIGKSRAQEMTPYGQQMSSRLGLTGRETPEMIRSLENTKQRSTNTPDVSYPKEAISNLTDNKTGREGEFLLKNLMGSAAAGATDKIMGVATNKILNKVAPKLLGKTSKVGGFKPSTIADEAGKLSEETWGVIQNNLDDLSSSGTTIDVTDVIASLEGRVNSIKSSFPGGVPAEALDDIAGTEKVIESLKNASTAQTTGIGSDAVETYIMDPKSVQKLKSYFGKTSFSPVTKYGKLSSNIESSAELTSKKMAGGQLRTKIINALQDNGLENADELFDEYGAYVNLADTMKRNPLSGALQAGVAGSMTSSLLSLMGAGPSAAAVPLATFGMMTPIGRQYIRQMLQAPVKAAGSNVVKGGVGKQAGDYVSSLVDLVEK